MSGLSPARAQSSTNGLTINTPAPTFSHHTAQSAKEPADGPASSFEEGPPGMVLIGLRVGRRAVNDPSRSRISGLQGIYGAPGRDLPGGPYGSFEKTNLLQAPPGFAIASVLVNAEKGISGVKVVFARVTGPETLAGEGTLESEWIGLESAAPLVLGGEGRPLIGMFGAFNTAVKSFGFILPGEKPAPPSLAPVAVVPPERTPAVASPRTVPFTMTTPGPPRSEPPGPPGSGPAGASFVQEFREGLVFIESPLGKGSGFVCMNKGQKFVFTNAHVLAGVQGPSFKLLDRSPLSVGAASVAVGHDIAALSVSNGGRAFEMLDGVDVNTRIGDEIVVLGNSEGLDVIRLLEGKIVGIGPNLVEVDADFVPGNSGSPIIHKRTGKVIGVATYLTYRKTAPYAGSTPSTVVRRFGYRLDSAVKWQPVQWQAFYAQAAELEKYKTLTSNLVDFLIDLSDGQINPGMHQNPAIKSRVASWFETRRRNGVSATDRKHADEQLLSSLKSACQSDFVPTQQRLTYDYFLSQLAKEQQERNELATAFTTILKAMQ